MKTNHRAILEKAICNAIEKIAGMDDCPDGLFPPLIAEHMTDAAQAVLDCSFESSKYTDEQK